MEKSSKYGPQKRYQAKTYERIALQERKEFCLNSRLIKAAEAKGVSKNSYIICVLESALEADGLPRPTDEEGC